MADNHNTDAQSFEDWAAGFHERAERRQGEDAPPLRQDEAQSPLPPEVDSEHTEPTKRVSSASCVDCGVTVTARSLALAQMLAEGNIRCEHCYETAHRAAGDFPEPVVEQRAGTPEDFERWLAAKDTAQASPEPSVIAAPDGGIYINGPALTAARDTAAPADVLSAYISRVEELERLVERGKEQRGVALRTAEALGEEVASLRGMVSRKDTEIGALRAEVQALRTAAPAVAGHRHMTKPAGLYELANGVKVAGPCACCRTRLSVGARAFYDKPNRAIWCMECGR